MIAAENESTFHIHGFADACERTYSAIFYLYIKSDSGTSAIHLICSNSRIAPPKTVSIPILELSASLIFCKLTERVVTALKLRMDRVTLCSDSTIA